MNFEILQQYCRRVGTAHSVLSSLAFNMRKLDIYFHPTETTVVGIPASKILLSLQEDTGAVGISGAIGGVPLDGVDSMRKATNTLLLREKAVLDWLLVLRNSNGDNINDYAWNVQRAVPGATVQVDNKRSLVSVSNKIVTLWARLMFSREVFVGFLPTDTFLAWRLTSRVQNLGRELHQLTEECLQQLDGLSKCISDVKAG